MLRHGAETTQYRLSPALLTLVVAAGSAVGHWAVQTPDRLRGEVKADWVLVSLTGSATCLFLFLQFYAIQTVPFAAYAFARGLVFLVRSRQPVSSISLGCTALSLLFFISSQRNVFAATDPADVLKGAASLLLSAFAEVYLVEQRLSLPPSIFLQLFSQSSAVAAVLALPLLAYHFANGQYPLQEGHVARISLTILVAAVTGSSSAVSLSLFSTSAKPHTVAFASAMVPLLLPALTIRSHNLAEYVGLLYIGLALTGGLFGADFLDHDFRGIADTPSISEKQSYSGVPRLSSRSAGIYLWVCALPLLFCGCVMLFTGAGPIDGHLWTNPMLLSSPVEGDRASLELYQAIQPHCPAEMPAHSFWPGARRTVLASFPRSGNTRTRALVERSSGFFTSTVKVRSDLICTSI
jgi:hypothetical protein